MRVGIAPREAKKTMLRDLKTVIEGLAEGQPGARKAKPMTREKLRELGIEGA